MDGRLNFDLIGRTRALFFDWLQKGQRRWLIGEKLGK